MYVSESSDRHIDRVGTTTGEQGQWEKAHKPTFALLLAWQVHEEAARQTAENRIIEVERSIGRTDDDHVALFVRLQSVHLLHELGDDPTVREGVTGFPGQTCAEQGIELVNEDDARRQPPGKREHGANKLLTLADILQGNRQISRQKLVKKS